LVRYYIIMNKLLLLSIVILISSLVILIYAVDIIITNSTVHSVPELNTMIDDLTLRIIELETQFTTEKITDDFLP